MNQEYKDLIIKHFVTLMKKCDVELLKKPLVDKGIFSQNEIQDIFSTQDKRHNKRVFFFNIQKKDKAFVPLLESLRETNQSQIADMFLKRRGAKVFNLPTPDDEVIPDLDNIPKNNSTTPLSIDVKLSDKLYDTFEHNNYRGFYKSRSKKRGRVLIINNYNFNDPELYRNGAQVDSENLNELFYQMGGWDLDHYTNKTTMEMDSIINNFANVENNDLYDICFVIIMSHGELNGNDTILFGVDHVQHEQHSFVSVSHIQQLFSNKNCKSWRTKPKIMLFPVCRGPNVGFPIKHEMRTETDSMAKSSQATNTAVTLSMRPEEDMLIGYSTSEGYKAHRDFNRGSWYIELLCEIFMKYAHENSVEELLIMIDEHLRCRMSENHTMQTAEYRNKGFKKLFLNPGLYFENDTVKKYRDDLRHTCD